MARDLSVVVFGATGITGRLACAHLAERAADGNGFKWAAAGRDPEKVAPRARRARGRARPRCSPPTSRTPASLAAMAARARVVLNMVGPYTLHGEPVIEACIAGGAHYMDLTGEIPFVRTMIERRRRACRERRGEDRQHRGFEALPPDLLVLLAAETARERWSEELATADLEADLPIPDGGVQARRHDLRRHPAEPRRDPRRRQRGARRRLGGADPRGGAGAAGPRREPDRDRAALQRPGRRDHADDPLTVHQPGGGPPHRGAARRRGRPGLQPLPLPRGRRDPGRRRDDSAALPGRSRPWAAARPRSAACIERALRSAGERPRCCAGASPPPASARPASAWRTGPGGWRSTRKPSAATTCGPTSRATASPATWRPAKMLGEAGLLLSEDGATPERSGFLTPARGAGDRADSTASATPASGSRSPPERARRTPRRTPAALAQRVGPVGPLPGEVLVGAAEVAVGGGLLVDRPVQVEVAAEGARAQVELGLDEA